MPTPIFHVPTERPWIALTFDDGPIPETTPAWIDLFAREGGKATFFDLGKKVVAEPALARRVFDAGHEIGNHTLSHPHLASLGPEEVRREIVECQALFAETFGEAPRVFRAPYGEHSDEVFQVLGELGLPSIMGKGYGDWSPEATVGGITGDYTRDTRPGDIYILHTWQTKTLEAMPGMIRRYREQGLELVTVSELLASAR